jgi:hypothetical protein
MVGRCERITAADRARFEAIRDLGCIACSIEQIPQPNQTEIHHLLSGGRRRGHAYSIPLCAWHHRGETSPGIKPSAMTACHGPSLRLASRDFHETYGSDDKLLAQVNELAGLTTQENAA